MATNGFDATRSGQAQLPVLEEYVPSDPELPGEYAETSEYGGTGKGTSRDTLKTLKKDAVKRKPGARSAQAQAAQPLKIVPPKGFLEKGYKLEAGEGYQLRPSAPPTAATPAAGTPPVAGASQRTSTKETAPGVKPFSITDPKTWAVDQDPTGSALHYWGDPIVKFADKFSGQLGIGKDKLIDTLRKLRDRPVAETWELTPAVTGLREAKRVGGELVEAGKAAMYPQTSAGAARHLVRAVPLAGPALEEGGERIAGELAQAGKAGLTREGVAHAAKAVPFLGPAAQQAGFSTKKSFAENLRVAANPAAQGTMFGGLAQGVLAFTALVDAIGGSIRPTEKISPEGEVLPPAAEEAAPPPGGPAGQGVTIEGDFEAVPPHELHAGQPQLTAEEKVLADGIHARTSNIAKTEAEVRSDLAEVAPEDRPAVLEAIKQRGIDAYQRGDRDAMLDAALHQHVMTEIMREGESVAAAPDVPAHLKEPVREIAETLTRQEMLDELGIRKGSGDPRARATKARLAKLVAAKRASAAAGVPEAEAVPAAEEAETAERPAATAEAPPAAPPDFAMPQEPAPPLVHAPQEAPAAQAQPTEEPGVSPPVEAAAEAPAAHVTDPSAGTGGYVAQVAQKLGKGKKEKAAMQGALPFTEAPAPPAEAQPEPVAAEAVAQPVAEPPATRKPARAKAPSAADVHKALADHFTPGNVIYSDYWKSYDKVLEFQPQSKDMQWAVKVIHVDKDGNPIPGERPRWHSTRPDQKDKVISRATPPPETTAPVAPPEAPPEAPSPVAPVPETPKPAPPAAAPASLEAALAEVPEPLKITRVKGAPTPTWQVGATGVQIVQRGSAFDIVDGSNHLDWARDLDDAKDKAQKHLATKKEPSKPAAAPAPQVAPKPDPETLHAAARKRTLDQNAGLAGGTKSTHRDVPVIAANDDAMVMLDKMARRLHSSNGLALKPERANQVVTDLRDLAAKDPENFKGAAALADLIDSHRTPYGNAVLHRSSLDEADINRVALEEIFHDYQHHYGLVHADRVRAIDNAMLSGPSADVWERVIGHLIKEWGYRAAVAPVEAPAWIAAGYDKFGITPDEAARVLADYFNAAENLIGKTVTKKLPPIDKSLEEKVHNERKVSRRDTGKSAKDVSGRGAGRVDPLQPAERALSGGRAARRAGAAAAPAAAGPSDLASLKAEAEERDPSREMVDIIHYSNSPDIDELDPARWGENPIHDVTGLRVNRPDEARKNAYPQYWRPEAYVGEEHSPAFRDKAAERHGVRKYTYRGQIPAHQVYDMVNDPRGLREQSRQELLAQAKQKFGGIHPPSEPAVEAYTIHKLKELGYTARRDVNGLIASWEKIPMRRTQIAPAVDTLPEHLRKPHKTFVSPNVFNLKDIGEARKRVGSISHRLMQQESGWLLKELGTDVKPRTAVGIWKDGAENSLIHEWPVLSDPDLARYHNAIMTKAGYQKAFYNFIHDRDGDDVIYRFTVPKSAGDISKINDVLGQNGLEASTIMKEYDGHAVLIGVSAEDEAKTNDSISNVISTLGGERGTGFEVRHYRGRSEFVGDDDRARAQQLFSRFIAEREAVHPEWGEVRTRLESRPDFRELQRIVRDTEGQAPFAEVSAGGRTHSVPTENVYDLRADPRGFREQVPENTRRRGRTEPYLKNLIREKGYDAYIDPASGETVVVRQPKAPESDILQSRKPQAPPDSQQELEDQLAYFDPAADLGGRRGAALVAADGKVAVGDDHVKFKGEVGYGDYRGHRWEEPFLLDGGVRVRAHGGEVNIGFGKDDAATYERVRNVIYAIPAKRGFGEDFAIEYAVFDPNTGIQSRAKSKFWRGNRDAAIHKLDDWERGRDRPTPAYGSAAYFREQYDLSSRKPKPAAAEDEAPIRKHFEADNFDERRASQEGAGVAYNPDSLMTGAELAKGMTPYNSYRAYPDQATYDRMVAGVPTEEVLRLAPRRFKTGGMAEIKSESYARNPKSASSDVAPKRPAHPGGIVTHFDADNFDSRRSSQEGAGNPYNPDSLMTGAELEAGMTPYNSYRDYPSQEEYDRMANGNVPTEEVLRIAPRRFREGHGPDTLQSRKPPSPQTLERRERAKAVAERLAGRSGSTGSTAPLMRADLIGEKFDDLAAIAKHLENYTREALTQLRPGKTPAEHKAMVDRAVRVMGDELKFQLAEENSGADWYKSDIRGESRSLMAWMQKLHPELKNKTKEQMFLAFTAATSPGKAAAFDNVDVGERVYDLYKQDGQVALTQPDGTPWGTYGNAPLVTLEAVLKHFKGDEAKAMNWLLEKHPLEELQKIKAKSGFQPSTVKDALPPKHDPSALYGAYVLGPKVGPFFLNLNGIATELTVDRWFMRTWNRVMGTLVSPSGKVQDTKIGKTERAAMIEAIDELGDQFGLSTSQVQAALWYYEQGLYTRHGKKGTFGGTYANAARYVHEVRSLGARSRGEAYEGEWDDAFRAAARSGAESPPGEARGKDTKGKGAGPEGDDFGFGSTAFDFGELEDHPDLQSRMAAIRREARRRDPRRRPEAAYSAR